jgi:hypothetical protein
MRDLRGLSRAEMPRRGAKVNDTMKSSWGLGGGAAHVPASVCKCDCDAMMFVLRRFQLDADDTALLARLLDEYESYCARRSKATAA